MDQIKIELCGGKMPTKAHETDAAFDVFTRVDMTIETYQRIKIPLGFKMQLPKTLAAVIQPRSGMSSKGMPCVIKYKSGNKQDFRADADVAVGLIDSGYTGEVNVIVCVGNGFFIITSEDDHQTKVPCGMIYGEAEVYIPAGTKIAQMRIVEIPSVELVQGEIDKDTERGDNGFGSSDEKTRKLNNM